MNIKLISILILFICCHKTIKGPTDCNGVSGGTAVEDCAGVCGGIFEEGKDGGCCLSSQKDDCDVCWGDGVLQVCGCGSPDEYGMPAGACDCDGEPCVNFSLEAEQSTLNMGDTLKITIQIEHVDNLYALTFKLEYESESFVPINEPTHEGTVSAGDLFFDPFLPFDPAFIQAGEINVSIWEQLETISSPVSGSACIIQLIAIGMGHSFIEIKDLQMIEPDGTSIEGLSTISVTKLLVTVFE